MISATVKFELDIPDEVWVVECYLDHDIVVLDNIVLCLPNGGEYECTEQELYASVRQDRCCTSGAAVNHVIDACFAELMDAVAECHEAARELRYGY